MKFSLPKMNSQSGFTLIELLVVLSIMSLLASMILTSTLQARRKARDAKRVSDMRQLQTALDLYYNQNNSQYPNPDPNNPDAGGFSCGGWDVSSYDPFISALKTSGIVASPLGDPLNTNNPQGGFDCGGYAYRYYRYPPGYCSDQCNGKAFYVLGINSFESNTSFASPGWKCTLGATYGGGPRDWGSEFTWVTAMCE